MPAGSAWRSRSATGSRPAGDPRRRPPGPEPPVARRIVVDNGPEFASTALDVWAYRRGVELQCTICKQCRYREGGPPGGPAYRHACRYGVSVPERPDAIPGTPGSLLYYEESSNTAAMIVC